MKSNKDNPTLLYRSVFGDWDDVAWIKQPVEPQEPATPGKEYYSARVFAAADHPLVAARGADVRSALLTKRLYASAHFTAQLERGLVNPQVLLIADDTLGVEFPVQVRADADRIYTDEAGHAQESNQIIRSVAAESGVVPVAFQPGQLNAWNRQLSEVPSELRPLAGLFLGIVSETLISATLSDIPRDPTVQPLVRWYTAEHARDEGRHHAFFAHILTWVWPQLSVPQKETIGRLVPKFMKVFLAPDVASVAADLASLGFGREEIHQIVAESVVPPGHAAGIRESARQSINHFRRVGALDIPSVRDAFEDESIL